MCHSDSLEPMENTVTNAYIMDGGNFYTTGSWEVLNNATATNNCTVTPKGSFKAAALKTISTAEGGDRKRQENNLSQIVFLARQAGDKIQGLLTFAGTKTPVTENTLEGNALLYEKAKSIEAFTKCGTNCTGSGFVGRCELAFTDEGFQVYAIAIQNHGSGYTWRVPPSIQCRYCSTTLAKVKCTEMQIIQDIIQIFVLIPRQATIGLEIARGGSVR